MEIVNGVRNIFARRLNKLVIYFLIYSFLGWCIEVSYVSISDGHFANRGFLIGPFCCIYGFGALLVIYFLKRFKHNPLLLFVSAAVITSILEYLTGYYLEKTFNNKWWDYSDQAFNISGRICLRNSLIWGAIAVVMVYFIHPFIKFAAIEILKYSKSFVAYFIIIYFVSDFIISAATAANITAYTGKIQMLIQEVRSYIHYMHDVTLKSIESILY